MSNFAIVVLGLVGCTAVIVVPILLLGWLKRRHPHFAEMFRPPKVWYIVAALTVFISAYLTHVVTSSRLQADEAAVLLETVAAFTVLILITCWMAVRHERSLDRISILFGCGFPIILAVVAMASGVWWVGYTFVYAPMHRTDHVPRSIYASRNASAPSPETVLLAALAQAFPSVTPRLDVFENGSVDIYVGRDDLRDVPFPDRETYVRYIGKAWCETVDHTYLPNVRLRDLHEGTVLAKYSCATDHVSVNFP
ncbi:MAG TPA: hypothetical protein VLC46_06880 [Thermoanaerobaculia bacterium]|jgi:hypothetical protein|nr:hypothetical protein [Thermoanaerobaculia bacterium]